MCIYLNYAFIAILFENTALTWDSLWVSLPPSLFISWHQSSWLNRGSQVPLSGYRDLKKKKRESNDNIEKDTIPQIEHGMQGRFPLLHRMAIYSQAWGTRALADLTLWLHCIHGSVPRLCPPVFSNHHVPVFFQWLKSMVNWPGDSTDNNQRGHVAENSPKQKHQMEIRFIFYRAHALHITGFSSRHTYPVISYAKDKFPSASLFCSSAASPLPAHVLHLLPLFSPPALGAASPLPSGQVALSSGGLAMPDGHKGCELLLRRERNHLVQSVKCLTVPYGAGWDWRLPQGSGYRRSKQKGALNVC